MFVCSINFLVPGKVISDIFNKSHGQGKLYTKLKTAKVITINKTGDKEICRQIQNNLFST